MAKKRRHLTQAEQSARFIEAAKKAEADERPEEFDKVVTKIVRRRSPPSGLKPKR